MRGARNNPNPITVCTNEEELAEQEGINKGNYNFYARVLRVVYGKPKLRNKMIGLMQEIENARYLLIPRRR